MRPTQSPAWRAIETGIQYCEADDLYNAALNVPEGGTIVEIGSFKGSSTYALASGCEGRNVKVYAVDTFMGSPGGPNEWKLIASNYFSDFKANLRDMIQRGIVIPCEMSSAGALMIRPKLRPHLLFIDGSHVYEDVLFDLFYWWERVQPNGVVALHDSTGDPSWHPQVAKALEVFCEKHGIDSVLLKGSISWFKKQ